MDAVVPECGLVVKGAGRNKQTNKQNCQQRSSQGSTQMQSRRWGQGWATNIKLGAKSGARFWSETARRMYIEVSQEAMDMHQDRVPLRGHAVDADAGRSAWLCILLNVNLLERWGWQQQRRAEGR